MLMWRNYNAAISMLLRFLLVDLAWVNTELEIGLHRHCS